MIRFFLFGVSGRFLVCGGFLVIFWRVDMIVLVVLFSLVVVFGGRLVDFLFCFGKGFFKIYC